MKGIATTLAALLLAGCAARGPGPEMALTTPQRGAVDEWVGLRPVDREFSAPPGGEPYAVLMESGDADGVHIVASDLRGLSSYYGVDGAVEAPIEVGAITEAGAAFVRAAAAARGRFAPAAAAGTGPRRRAVRFYAVGGEGLTTVEVAEAELKDPAHPLHALHESGLAVRKAIADFQRMRARPMPG